MAPLASLFAADGFHIDTAQFALAGFWLAVLRLAVVDLLLSGDNAVVIAMACRGLPAERRRWGLMIGAAAAIVLRIVLVGVLAWLLLLPYLKTVGGLALVLIAARLVVTDDPVRDGVRAAAQLWRVAAIVAIADLIMSLDNMVAVAAIANGNLLLLGIGLVLSIPLIVAGSGMVMVLLNRFPFLNWAGAALLGWIAGAIVIDDPALLARVTAAFGAHLATQFTFAAPATGAALAVAAGGLWSRWRDLRRAAAAPARES